MEVRLNRRLGARLSLAALIALASARAPAASLLRFEFDTPEGAFTLLPTLLAPALQAATWSDDMELLADFAGQPGRALATSGFTLGNALHLDIDIASGHALAVEALAFALRVSPSGPQNWALYHAGALVASGATSTKFTTFDVALVLPDVSDQLRLDLFGSGATALSGTLRIDNVELRGQLSAVSLPGPVFLLATPLLGYLARRAREARIKPRRRPIAASRRAAESTMPA